MSTLVYMKLLEQTPAKYDRGMQLVTLGQISAIKHEMSSSWVEPGHVVLEIGCGTGSLAAFMTARGASVTGIDVSEPMLAVAREAAPDATLYHMTATEIDRLPEASFDRIVSTLVFSELSEDELDFVLRASAKLLKPGGLLVVADEVRPAGLGPRLLASLVRLPLAAVTFVLTQTTTHALKGFEGRLERAGFRLCSRKPYLAGTMALFAAEKP